MRRIQASFFQRPTLDVARELLGSSLFVAFGNDVLSGVIVETEAYLHEADAACHAARGKTKRNQVMFGPPGVLYVYTIHTRYCMNIVTESEGKGAAVLIRAIQPTKGMDSMLENRKVIDPRELTNGPGKLCQAMGVTTSHNGLDLTTSSEMWLQFRSSKAPFTIQTTPRIGISQSKELPYRFLVNGNRFVSGLASDHSIPKRMELGP